MMVRARAIAGVFHYVLHEFKIALDLKRFFRFRHFYEVDQRMPEKKLLFFITLGAKAFHHVVDNKVRLLHLISPITESKARPLRKEMAAVCGSGAVSVK